MNEYETRIIFLDEDGFKLESQIMTPLANSPEEAYDLIDAEICDSNILYPSDDYELELIDVH